MVDSPLQAPSLIVIIGTNPGVMKCKQKFKREKKNLGMSPFTIHHQMPTEISERVSFQKPVYVMQILGNAALLNYFLIFHHKHKKASLLASAEKPFLSSVNYVASFRTLYQVIR